MVYDYKVKHNGVYYLPGENVPDDEPVWDAMNPPEITEEEAEAVAPVKKKGGRPPKAR